MTKGRSEKGQQEKGEQSGNQPTYQQAIKATE